MSALTSFAEVVVDRLAWASLQATLLAGGIWLAGRYMPRLPASTRSLLWWLLGVQLLLGLVVATPLQLRLLSPAPNTVAEAPVVSALSTPLEHHFTTVGRVADATSMQVADTAVAATAAEAGSTPASWKLALFALWLAGVLVQAMLAWHQWLEARAVMRSSLPLNDPALRAACARQAKAMGLRRCPSLRVSPAIGSPQVTGLWRTTVLLPTHQSLSAEESALALAHELAHLRRGDLWMGWVPAVAQRLFFFHPLVTWGMREYALHREAACDAQVVQHHDAAPQDYGRLLLRLGVAHPLHAGLAGASPTFNNLKRRLTMLQQSAQDTTSGARGWLLIALVAAAGVLPYRVTRAASEATSAAPAAAASAAQPTQQATAVTQAVPARAVSVAPKATSATVTETHLHAHTSSVPPVPPTPPAPPTPPIPRTPPTPPTPPTLPADTNGLHASHVDIDIDNGSRNGFALFDRDADSIMVNGTSGDIESAKRERKANESMLWIRRDQQAYVIRDDTYIRRAQNVYAPMKEMARMQGRLASEQGRLAGAQGRLSGQQGAMASRMGALAAREAQLESQRSVLEAQRAALEAQSSAPATALRQLDAQTRALDSQIKALADRQREPRDEQAFAQQQADIERQQADLERQQQALEKQQREVFAKADRDMQSLMAEAIAKGAAQPASAH